MTHWGDSFASDATVLRHLGRDGQERFISLVGRRELKVGSSRESDLVLDGPDVAAVHCRIYEQQGRLTLVDRGSSAGTLINGLRCIQPTVLREGDRIGIGYHLLQVMPRRAHLGTEAIAEQMAVEPHEWSAGEATVALQFAQQLCQAAAAWEARRRPARLLLAGERLVRAVGLAGRPAQLGPWLAASAARRRRHQGLRWLLAGFVPGALVAALLAGPSLGAPGPTDAPAPATPLTGPAADDETPSGPPSLHCRPLTHPVAAHETLDEIAARYDVDPRRLAADNDLSPGAALTPGQAIAVCTTRPVAERRPGRVEVGPGDTWESVARRHAMTVDELRRLNPRRPATLAAGDVVDVWTDTSQLPAVRDLATPETPSGGRSEGTPGEGELKDGVTLHATDFFDVRCTRHAVASSHTLHQLQTAMVRLREVYNYHGQIVVGDLSKQDGGGYGRHMSHQSGRDVDIWLPIEHGVYRSDAQRCAHCGTTWCRPDPIEVDWDAAFRLVQALHDTGAIQNVFLDRALHPALRDAARRAGLSPTDIDRMVQPRAGIPAVVTHSDNHEHHVHVRFRCGPEDAGCRQ